MGTGWGTGQGAGKGVKGGWRVSAFLLLLTGWQAVLLPWSPLILKDAGFSATSVGVLSGGTTLAASVGVVMCLWGMRRNRSGAVRRLLLWLMLATAALLQGCGVGFVLRNLSQGGVMPSCVGGWLFAPATPAFLLNNVSTPTTRLPKIVPLQQSHNLSTSATATQPPPSDGPHEAGANPHLPHSNLHRPTPVNSTTTITTTPAANTSTTVSAVINPIPPIPVTLAKITITTTTIPATTTPPRTTPRHATVPAIKTTSINSNDRIPLNSNVTTTGTLTFSEDDDSESWKEETTGMKDSSATEAPHRLPPVGQQTHQAAHKPLTPARDGPPRKNHHNNIHAPDVSLKNSERGKNFGKPKYQMNYKNIQLPDDKDHPTSEDNLEDNDNILQDVDEYDSYEKSEEKGDEVDYEDDLPKFLNYYPRPGSRFLPSFGKLLQSSENTLPDVAKTVNFPDIPSNNLQHDMSAKVTTLRKPYLQGMQKNLVKSFENPHHTDFFTPRKRKQNRMLASLLNNKESLPPVLSQRHHPHIPLLPMTKARRPHISSRLIKDPSDGKRQYGGHDLHQIDSARAVQARSRRDLMKTENRSHIHLVKASTNEMKPQHDEKLENNQNPLEVKSEIVKVGVAVLLVLGGLVGAGVEAGVAQLWHCFVHGYDENGVSQDVLQRTITHTFHLSTYGNHKTWTGITSGGWAMGAGMVSFLACLAGAGGGGYGGLLGMHLALGMGALLLLLVLPVPYGSINPPKTRRPLSLYLDDEVLREGVRRLAFHIWVFINGCLAALSLTFSLWLLQEMTAEGWLVGGQASAVGVTLVCESLALHTQRRLVIRWGLHGLMGVCGMSLMLHYGIMWASKNVGVVVAAHAGLGVAMAFLWVAVKHNALLLATVSDQEREAWASWWCWRFGVSVGAAVWGVGVSGGGEKVRPLLLMATLASAILAFSLCVTAALSRRHFRTRRRVYHTLDLDIANDEVDEDENDAAEDDWLVKRAKKEGLTL